MKWSLQSILRRHLVRGRAGPLVWRSACSDSRPPTPKCSPPWDIMFFGTDDFSLKSLELLHKEQRAGTRGLVGRLDVVSVPLKKIRPAVRQYCQHEGLPLLDWPVVVPPGTYDVGVVVSFGQLIPASVISAFPMGILNVHGSLLPRWRGAAPIIHALLNGDHHTGITLMLIEPNRFDVGRVVSKVAVPVDWNAKSGEVTKQLAEVGARELVSVLPSLPCHLQNAVPQSSEGITKAPKVSEKMSRVQWREWSCRDIQNHYRALDDIFPLWSVWHGTPVKLRQMVMQQKWSSFPKDTEVQQEEPTHVGRGPGSGKKNCDRTTNCALDSSNMRKASDKESEECGEGEVAGSVVYERRLREVRVRCRDGWVAFHQVVLKGRRPMTAQDFYNGFISKVTKDLHRFT